MLTDRDIQNLREQLRQEMREAGTLDKLPVDGRSDRRERAAKDPAWFLRFYCPHYFPHAFSPRHREALDACNLRSTLFLLSGFRGWGKSAVGSFGHQLYCIYQETRRFLLLIANTEDMAEPFSNAIKMEIEENPRLRQDYGNLVGVNIWQSLDFVTRNNRRVLARGVFQPFRGLRHGPHRPDDATFDDAENDRTAESVDQCRKIARRVWAAVRPAMRRGKDGGFCWRWIGTPITRNSITWQLIQDDERDIHKLLVPIVDASGQSAWPEVYDAEEIEQTRRASGLHAWHSEYLLNPLPSEEAMFRPEWIQYADQMPEFAERDITLGMIDTSGTVKGDYKAAGVWTLHRATMDIYTRHAWIRRGSPRELWEAVAEQQRLYDCAHIIEDNAIKDYLGESLALFERDRQTHLRLRRLTHTRAKQEHILPLQSPMERGKIWFQKNHSDQTRLIEQLLAFPNGKNDEGPDIMGEAYLQIMRRVGGDGAGQQKHSQTSRRSRRGLSALRSAGAYHHDRRPTRPRGIRRAKAARL